MHREPIFKALKLLKVEDMLKLNDLKFYYKYENSKLPKYFSKTQFVLTLNSENKNNLNATRTNHKFAKKCLRKSIPNTMNSVPNKIRNKTKHSMQTFVNYIKTLYLGMYIGM